MGRSAGLDDATRTYRKLSAEEVRQFHEQGFLGPIRVWSADEMESYRKYVAHEVLGTDNPQEGVPGEYYRHVDDPVVYDLCSHPEIVARMADLYGPHLLLWSSKFWNKTPGGAEVPWHQHYYHLPLQPKLSVTAWVALTDVTKANGCLEMIPGSHQHALPQVASPPEKSFEEMTDPEYVDDDRAVPLELDPGEVVLFTERTLHRSSENDTDATRLGMSMRVTTPLVHVDLDDVGDPDYSTVMRLAGENWAGVNSTTTPPTHERD